MTLRFLDPLWLALLALALPLAFFGWRWLRAMTATRRWASIVLRALLVAAAALALAGASLVRTVDQLCIIALVDVSPSVQRLYDTGRGPDGKPLPLWNKLEPLLDAGSQHRRADDTSAVIAFGSDAAVAIAPQTAPPGRFVATQPNLSELAGQSGSGTNLAGALRLARAMVPPGYSPRFILISDGVSTDGAADSSAALTESTTTSSGSAARIPIDTLSLDYSVTHEVALESVEIPSLAPAESTIQVRITLDATAQASGTLQLAREGEAVNLGSDAANSARRITLQPGRNTLLFPVKLPPGRVHRFDAVFTPDPGGDTLIDNNRMQAVTLTPGRSSVLLVDGVSGGDAAGPGATLANALRQGSGVEVQLASPESISADPLWLQRYDLIILQNVPADALGAGVTESLANYVARFGGGLVMVGGPDSFGAGGWKGTPVEPILPVTLDLPERLVSPAAAVVIIIDCSGSMGFRVMGTGRTQQQIANEGAAAAAEAMDKSDLLGVIMFNENYDVLVPLAPNHDPAGNAALIRTIRPDGGTNLPPALDEAHRQLNAAKADIKHVIILSDGVSQGANTLPQMAEGLLKDNIHVSTIAVGDQADTRVMSEMANAGDGTFYLVTDPTLLPRIFVKAVRIVRSPQVREVPFTPRLLATGSPLVEGLSEPLPQLGGLVLTQARLQRGVDTPLATPTGEPVLAHWSAGVGHVAAFTSDAHKWAAPWLNSPSYARLWMQIVRNIARPQPDRGQELLIEPDGDKLRLRVTAADNQGKPRDGLSITGWVHHQDNTRDAVTLIQTGPGEYEGTAPLAPNADGPQIVTLTPTIQGKPLPPLIGGVSRPTGAEFRRLKSDPDLLARIARESGGRVLSFPPATSVGAATSIPDLFEHASVKPLSSRTPIWHALLIAMIAGYLLDIGCRRIAWDRLLMLDVRRAVRQHAAEAATQRGERAARVVGRLRQTEGTLESTEKAATDRGSAPPKLSDEDAKAIIRAEQERRKQARAAARAAQRTAPSPTASAPSESPPIETITQTPDPAPTSPPSLLDAKRRARRKMDEDLDSE